MKAAICRYYRQTASHATCKAGIAYGAVYDAESHPSLPCFNEAVPCGSRRPRDKSGTWRYKVILNVDITDPDKPFPAGGDYTHLSRIEGIVHSIASTWPGLGIRITLDKVIDKGEIDAPTD